MSGKYSLIINSLKLIKTKQERRLKTQTSTVNTFLSEQVNSKTLYRSGPSCLNAD